MSDIDNPMETASRYEEQSFQVHQASGDESNKNDLLSGIVIKIETDDLLPLDDAGLQMPDSSDVSDYKEEIKSPKNEEFVHKSLLTNDANEPFGAWEEHTRGIGSKLMARMGYVPGTGLGKKSDGIISPCKALIFPAGRSLDHCFTLKNNAGGDKDLLNVERKLLKQNLKLFKKVRKQNKQFERKMQKQKKKLERQKREGYLREEQQKENNAFDCINVALESKSNESELGSSDLRTELEKASENDYRRMFQDWRNNPPN